MTFSETELAESQRLAALRRYDVLNTPPGRALDDLAELAASICEMPIAVVTLVDETTVQFKAKFGVELTGIPRAGTFCECALQGPDVLMVPDSAKDERFAKNPFVDVKDGIRFYAGAPLITPEGHALGTLCVLDQVPRTLTRAQVNKLRVLSRQVMAQMELHRQACELSEKERVHATLIGNLPGMAFRGIKDRERTFTFVSEGCKGLTGYDPDDLVENRVVSYGALIHPEDRGWVWERCKADLDSGRPSTAEYRIIDRSGKTRWVSERATGFYGSDGKLVSIEGFIQEITERKLAEQEKSLSLSLMTATLESTADGILVVSTEGKFVTFNQTFAGMWRMDEELLAKGDDQLCLQFALSQLSEPQQFIDKVTHLYTHPLEESFDTLLFKDGRIFERYSRPQVIEGEVVGRVWSFRDVTEKKQADTKLRENEERFRLLFDGAKDAIFGADAETGVIMECNRAAEELMGRERSEMIGQHQSSLHPPEDMQEIRKSFARHAQAVTKEPVEADIVRKDGQRVPVSISPALITIHGRQIVQGIFRDITERRRMERLLNWENDTLELIATTASLDEILSKLMHGLENLTPGALGSVLLLDEEGTHLRHGAAPSLPAAYNQAIDGIAIGPNVGSCGTAAYEKRQVIVEDIANDSLWKNYKDLARGHGLAACWSTPIRGSTGKLLGTFAIYFREPRRPTSAELEMIGQVQNLVGLAIERKQVEETLEMMRFCVDRAGEAVFWISEEGRVLYVNHAGCAERGYSREEMLQMKIFDLDPDFPTGVWETHWEDLKKQRVLLFETRHRAKDGRTFPVEVCANYIQVGAKELLCGFVRDISERKRAEARLQRLVNSNVQGVSFIKLSGEITQANDAFLKMIGYSREEMEAGKLNWRALTPPEFADEDRLALRELAEKKVCATYEKEYIRKEGTRVPILVGTAAFEDNPQEGVCYVVDLTERKALELQFLRAQRMECIGTLAGGIAHDLNNALSPIMISLSLLRMRFTDPSSQELLDTLSASAQRGSDMVRQVLSFARGIEGRRMEVQIRHIVQDLERTVRDTFLKTIAMQTAVPNDLWTVLGDPTQLHQVLLNLCVNARDAMPSGGRLTISAANVVLDAAFVSLNPESKPGPYVFLQVEDTGTGIPAEILEKIFDPFFTTKEVGKGTGLGLSTSLAIVKSHGGFMRVHSESGKGTRFEIRLPASAESPTDATPDPAPVWPRGNDELILVVDDEASVRKMMRQTLEAFGYRVLLAREGTEAVALYATHQAEIAAVLTDMTMPVMDGLATIQILRKINPAVRIIAASGLAEDSRLVSLGVKHFLPKPYPTETLLTMLREIISQK